jgi:cyclopropane-fatty-acyl-phospholipid synthase
MYLLSKLFNQIFKIGRLTVIDVNGRNYVFGSGDPKPAMTIRFHDKSVKRALLLNPRLALGEAYMNGKVTIENGTIYEFLDFCAINMEPTNGLPAFDPLYKLEVLFRSIQQFNPVGRAKENVHHHYDLSGTLYDLFLDADRQYSCAFFRTDNDSLEAAQDNKKRHIAAKLFLKPGVKVLDIGSGWGGMGIYLAKVGAGHVDGVTLSTEQHERSNRRAARPVSPTRSNSISATIAR